MVPFYEHVCQKLSIPRDEALVRELTAASDEKIKALAEKLKDAEENLGETEVADARHAQAAFLAGMGHKVNFSLSVRLVAIKLAEYERQ